MKIFFGSNLKVLRERKKRSQQEVADFVGLKRGLWNAYENDISNPSLDNLIKISDYFGININTLLTVDFAKLSGAQLADLENGLDVFVKGSKLRILPITVNEHNEDNVEFVSVKAKAGYSAGYGDPEYISTLPSFHLPFLPKGKKYRAFQADGHSMLPVKNNEWNIYSYIENWNSVKNGKEYVVITQSEGVLFKRVYSLLEEKNALLMVSTNPEFKPYEIPIEEVREVWEYEMTISKLFD